nr:hypothetical protein [uncultured Mediterranean phage uvMED]
MNFSEAVELCKGWPEDRSVPRRLAEGIATAADKDVQPMAMLVEALTVAADTPADFELIAKYFD